jgi:outer membrane protein assembly factor BamE (lipoprotein component of BamABCDE complex)
MSLPTRSKHPARALVVAAIFALAGCVKDIDQRGNLPTNESLAQLAIGEQTRQDVQTLLGTPATTAVFDDETWYYISSHTVIYSFYKTAEFDRTIYALSFDDRGILKDVRKFDMKDGHKVQISTRETPTKGREYGVLEQLLGNIGRFSAPRRAPGPQ